MNISIEALTVLLYLTPGLFASMFLDLILVRKEKDALSRLFEALVFSLVTYGIAALWIGALPVTIGNTIDASGKVISKTLTFDSRAIMPTLMCGLALPLAVGHGLTASWFMKVLRYMRITGRTGRESTWLDVFHEQKQYIVVHFIDGRRLLGWPSYYSDYLEEGLLYLSNVTWYDATNISKSVAAHGIFLVGLAKIDYIEFTNVSSKDVAALMMARRD